MLIFVQPNDLNAKEHSTISKRLGKDAFYEIVWHALVNCCLWQYLVDCDVVLVDYF